MAAVRGFEDEDHILEALVDLAEGLELPVFYYCRALHRDPLALARELRQRAQELA